MSKPHEEITARIVAKLEAGVRPWSKGWNGATGTSRRPLRSNGVPYKGINQLWLRMAAMERGFNSPHWLTFKGALALGGNVRKGAKSEPAFYAGTGVATTDLPDGTSEDRLFHFLKSYRVFNADECDGLPAHMTVAAPPLVVRANPDAPIAEAEAFIAATGARVAHGGAAAFYMPAMDRIQLPAFSDFHGAAEYYGTALHELAHWTGAPHRLDRKLSMQRAAYAAEEMVAEMTAAFLCGDLQIEPEVRDDHASYLACWIKWLRDDSRAIFTAAAAAEKAAGFLHALQPGHVAPAEEREAA